MTTIVYSTTRVPAGLRPEGARYLNPSFFTGCEPGATLVYVNGDMPKVRAAYERAGVPVADLRCRTAPVAALSAPQPAEDGGSPYRSIKDTDARPEGFASISGESD